VKNKNKNQKIKKKQKQNTHTRRKNSLVPKYNQKIIETDTFNTSTNNEKKLKSAVGVHSSCSTCDTRHVTLVTNLVIRP
jgi:hypothetical protein